MQGQSSDGKDSEETASEENAEWERKAAGKKGFWAFTRVRLPYFLPAALFASVVNVAIAWLMERHLDVWVETWWSSIVTGLSTGAVAAAVSCQLFLRARRRRRP